MQVRGVEEMSREAARFAATLVPHPGGATVVTLQGDLGAGKTTFARAIASHFGIEENVTSPTFVIEKIYPVANGPFKRLIHIDAYRLSNSHEIEVLGWNETARDAQNLILLEWPEHVPDALPAGVLPVRFTFVDESVREVIYD